MLNLSLRWLFGPFWGSIRLWLFGVKLWGEYEFYGWEGYCLACAERVWVHVVREEHVKRGGMGCCDTAVMLVQCSQVEDKQCCLRPPTLLLYAIVGEQNNTFFFYAYTLYFIKQILLTSLQNLFSSLVIYFFYFFWIEVGLIISLWYLSADSKSLRSIL